MCKGQYALPSPEISEVQEALHECSNLTQLDIDSLIDRGVPVHALMSPLSIARSRVSFQGRYCFEFDPTGEAVLILPAIEDGDLLDVVAWHPKSGRVAAWLGCVNALGWGDLYAPNLTGDPMNVWASPLGWLKANRTGMTPINVEAWARSLFYRGDHVAAFVTEDPAHGRAIRSAFDRKPPRVFVPELVVAA